MIAAHSPSGATRAGTRARLPSASNWPASLGAPIKAAATAILVAIFLGAVPTLAAPADDGQTAAARNWVLYQGRLATLVTPDDSNDLATAPTRFVYIGQAAACNLAVRWADGGTTAVTITALSPGVFHPIQIKRVMATNTTCTVIMAVY